MLSIDGDRYAPADLYTSELLDHRAKLLAELARPNQYLTPWVPELNPTEISLIEDELAQRGVVVSA